MDESFTTSLLSLIRAQDRSGAWEGIPDDELLAPFIVTKAEKRQMPMFGDPDPDILWRVELYYQAIAWEVEKQCGRQVSPLLKIHHEGWGRVVLIAGRLVALDVHVRELARFGFESKDTMRTKAQALITEAANRIANNPDIAAA